MANLYKIIPLIFALKACGTQDYSEWDEKPQEKVAEAPELSWRARALAAQLVPAILVPPHDEKTSDCPANTLCIEASFLSGRQWRGLGSRYPGHISLREEKTELIIRVDGSSRILIEGDILNLGSDRLVLCGKENVISVSRFEGKGVIDTSGSACGKKDAGDLSLIAHEFESHPKVLADGIPGTAGENANAPAGEEQAASGNPGAPRIQVDVDYLKGRWPLTRAGAEGVGERQGADAALRYLRTLSQMGLYSEQTLEDHLSRNCSDCDKRASRWYQSRNAGCFFYFQNDGLFNGAKSKVVGIEGLDGKPADPSKVWRGEDGKIGGNSGRVIVLSSHLGKQFAGAISAQGGKGGPGGSGAYQLPGLGVQATLDSVTRRINEKHWVSCIVRRGNQNIEVADWTNPSSRTVEMNFTRGGPTAYDRFGQSSGTLSVRNGRNGKGISKEIIESLQGSPGEPGASHEPEIHLLPVADFVSKFEEICSDCLSLSIVEEELLGGPRVERHD